MITEVTECTFWWALLLALWWARRCLERFDLRRVGCTFTPWIVLIQLKSLFSTSAKTVQEPCSAINSTWWSLSQPIASSALQYAEGHIIASIGHYWAFSSTLRYLIWVNSTGNLHWLNRLSTFFPFPRTKGIYQRKEGYGFWGDHRWDANPANIYVLFIFSPPPLCKS